MILQACSITIITTADGQETKIARNGQIALSALSARIIYQEENAHIDMFFQGDEVTIERKGDYTLRLHLKNGEKTVGSIGLGDASGQVETYARKVSYSLSENSLLALLHYDLIISGEKQEMQLRIHAKTV